MRKSLNPRLTSAAEFVRRGARFADVGTDHAYLPIFLLGEGRISYALCTDINEGPLASAVANARDAGLYEKMDFCLTDGAAALSSYGITDMAICGMGGDLIASIVEAAEYLRDENVNLILQPMTKQEALRESLYLMGYEIIAESYSRDAGKPYVCMQVKYCGVKKELPEFEREVCPKNAKIVNKDLQKVYLEKKISIYKKIINGKKCGGNEEPRELHLARMIEEYLTKGE
jgi:tRNA (adenine22-N1)-methyltransferase